MKRRIHIELLVTSGLAILLTLTFAMFVFYGLFRSQIIRDLETDARVMKNMGVFDDISRIAEKNGSISSEDLRITVVSPGGDVLFDSSADAAVMENHEDRPEIRTALEAGEGSGSRRSETMDKNLFYYAVRMENGNVLRISREADSFFAVFQNMLPTVLEVSLVLFVLSIFLSNYFTKTLVGPIEEMARNISDPGQEVVYRELEPFVATIRQQHDDIIKSAQMRQEFTANVSHELKTPLTAISGYAELIEHGMADADNSKRFAGEIHKNSVRLLSLINDIIQLSQLDGGKNHSEYADIDLYKLAAECVDMLKMNARKQNVTMKLCGKPCTVYADRQLMEELLYNLCDNAIRYNNRGGSVTVTVDEKDGHVFLSIRDTGIGIPTEHQDRVFERFYRVDKSRSKATGGTGLGLAIVKHIVAQHGASISLESQAGKGTEIRVEFSDVLKRQMEERAENA